jgi:hypothetical protein
MSGVLYARDPSRGWVPVGGNGPEGPAGPPGPEGPPGADGTSLPPGGAVGAPLLKASAADEDVKWGEGESFVTVGWKGGFTFEGGGGLFWRGPDEANQAICIREAAGGLQPRIANGDGTAERDIIDTTNGDGRYLKQTGGTVTGTVTSTVAGPASGLTLAGAGSAPIEFRAAADTLNISQFGRSNGLAIHPYQLHFMDILIADVNGPKLSDAAQAQIDNLRDELSALRARVAALEGE